MKRMRKVIAAMMTALCLSCTATPLISSATTYDPCDVNHDGSVDVLDVTIINQHITGAKYYTNYNWLDANQSHTIDSTDSTCVMNKVVKLDYSACYIRQYGNGYMQPLSMPAVSSAVTLDDSADDTGGRWYVGYSYLEKADIPRYQLVPTTANLNFTENTQSRSMINNDDNRAEAHGYENTGIVAVGNATGFIVGDHQIATAAHCVCIGSHIKINTKIRTYDRSGLPTGTELTIAEIHVPEEYTSPCSIYDYALITVVEDLSDYIHFDIGNCYNMTDIEVGSIPIHITGQPQYIGDDLSIPNTTDTLYTHQGSIYESNNQSFLYYAVDTSQGQSGAPAYTITRERYNNKEYYTYTALAVHTTSYGSACNYGTLMTQYHLQFYKQNPNIGY